MLAAVATGAGDRGDDSISILHWPVSLPKGVFLGKKIGSKKIVRPKKYYFHSPLEPF